jgi:excisionase family DNA binding protein
MSPTPKTPTQNPLATGDQLLTVAEVASFLRLSTTAVYALCHSGQLPHFAFAGRGKKTKTIRVKQSDLDAFLESSREERQAVEVPSPRSKPRAARGAGAGASILRSLGYDPSKVN